MEQICRIVARYRFVKAIRSVQLLIWSCRWPIRPPTCASQIPTTVFGLRSDGANMPHRSPLSVRQGDPVCATLNLVVPLAHKATDMRIADTADGVRAPIGWSKYAAS